MRFSAISCEIAGYLSLIHLKNLGTPIFAIGAKSAVYDLYGGGIRALWVEDECDCGGATCFYRKMLWVQRSKELFGGGKVVKQCKDI
jgi:hypothetical protein